MSINPPEASGGLAVEGCSTADPKALEVAAAATSKSEEKTGL